MQSELTQLSEQELISAQPQVFNLVNALYGGMELVADGAIIQANIKDYGIFSISRALVVNTMLGVALPVGRNNDRYKYYDRLVTGTVVDPEDFDYVNAQVRLKDLFGKLATYFSLKPRDDSGQMDLLAKELSYTYGMGLLGGRWDSKYIDKEIKTIPNSLDLIENSNRELNLRTRLLTLLAGKILGRRGLIRIPSAQLLEVGRKFMGGLFDTFVRNDGTIMNSQQGKRLVNFRNGIATDLKFKGSTRQGECMNFIPGDRQNGGNVKALKVHMTGGKRVVQDVVNTLELKQPELDDCIQCPLLGLCLHEGKKISNAELDILAVEALYRKFYEDYQVYLSSVQI